MDKFDKNPKPGFNAREADEGSGATIAIIVAAFVLVVGAFIYFGSGTTADGPQVTQNDVAPAPITEPATPLPATPPAAEPLTPPATPPADAPAANP